MSAENDVQISAEEKQILVATTTIVHRVVKEITDSEPKSKWEKIIRHPLLLLLIGTLISGIIIFQYQESYTKHSEQLKTKIELMTKTSTYTGNVLANAANIVYLHTKPIRGNRQIRTTNQGFNIAYDQFNTNYLQIAFMLKIIFEEEKIDKNWLTIFNEIEQLNTLLDHLGKLQTDDQTIEHPKRIDQCNSNIEAIKKKLDQLADDMLHSIK
jgi:hypothetical protein